jgi:hypothetical protein
VIVLELDEPHVEDGVTYTHMTVCPETGVEVLIHLYSDPTNGIGYLN